MAPRKVQLRNKLPDAAMARLKGTRVQPEHWPVLLVGDTDVYRPDGEPLCLLRRGALLGEQLDRAQPELRRLKAYGSDNRSVYAGIQRTRSLNPGSSGKNTRTRDPETGKAVTVNSAIAGYFERQGGRIPLCRATAFVAKEVERWREVVPLVEQVAGLLRAELPQRYAKQLAETEKVPPEYTIRGTPFTTLTVNNNIAAAIHQDAGDFKEGFGVLSVCARGAWSGCHLVFPQYGVAAQLGHGDVLLFNPHDWHGNTPIEKHSEDAERISVVYYMRRRLTQCLPATEELERAKRVTGALA